MIKIAYNIPRHRAETASNDLSPSQYAWISIQEPGKNHITNDVLDKLPKIKLKFWDVVRPVHIFNSDEIALPLEDEDINTIFKFLMEHKDKNIISNCAAGASRSGAISRFCVDYLGHTWDEESKGRAQPNSYIYDKLVEEYKLFKGHNDQYDMKPLVVKDTRRKYN